MIESTIQVRTPQSWVRSIVSKYPAEVRILDCKTLEGTSGVQELFEIRIDESKAAPLLADMRKDRYIASMDVVETKQGVIFGSVKTNRCTACRSFAGSGCFLTSVKAIGPELMEWTVLSSNENLNRLLKELESTGVEAKLKKVIQLKTERALTTRQEEIIQIALEKGFFDFPRRTSLRSLAVELGISGAALSEILRRGERRIYQEYFRGRPSTLSRQARIS